MGIYWWCLKNLSSSSVPVRHVVSVRTVIAFLLVFPVLYGLPSIAFAAGGGPPMITDDPGTPDVGSWEINISFNTELLDNQKELEAPLLDINYGLDSHTQLKVEVPYLLDWSRGEGWEHRFGHVTPGIKYRFLDQDKAGVSMSIYPQVGISTEEGVRNEYLIPVELEINLGDVCLGTDIRYIYINGEEDVVEHGILAGYSMGNGLDVMMELAYGIGVEEVHSASGVLNFGLRYELSETVTFISSMGTGIFQAGEEHTDFISFTGVQLNL